MSEFNCIQCFKVSYLALYICMNVSFNLWWQHWGCCKFFWELLYLLNQLDTVPFLINFCVCMYVCRVCTYGLKSVQFICSLFKVWKIKGGGNLKHPIISKGLLRSSASDFTQFSGGYQGRLVFILSAFISLLQAWLSWPLVLDEAICCSFDK